MHTITNIEAILMIIPPYVRNGSLVLAPSHIMMQKAKYSWIISNSYAILIVYEWFLDSGPKAIRYVI